MAKYSVFQVNVGENQERNQRYQQHQSASFDLNQNEKQNFTFWWSPKHTNPCSKWRKIYQNNVWAVIEVNDEEIKISKSDYF